MTRRAAWRRLPSDAQAGRLRRFARDLWTICTVQIVACSLALFGPAVLVALAVGKIFGGVAGYFSACMTPLILVFLMGSIRKRLKASALPDLFEALLPLPLLAGAFPVYLELRYRGVLTGIDEGVVCFVEGWLHFDGVRTDFDVHAGDGRGEWRDNGTLLVALPGGQSLVVRLMHDRGLKPSHAHFRHAANLWISDADRPEGESILPPKAFHPSAQALWMLQTAVVASLLVAAPILAVLLLTKVGPTLWIVQTVGAALFGRGVGVLWRGERQDRKARLALEREAS